MHFLYPSVFWALAALLIPILIHLFNFRRHKLVYFSNTATLRNIQQESARTKKLKHLVLLLLRCLFIIALVFAFAFPYRTDEAAKINPEEGIVGVYIDNSMSMRALSDKTTLLEDAREMARDLVNEFPPSARYLLLTNSFEVENEYPMSQQEMLDQIDRMRIDGPPVKLNQIIDRFAMLRKRHGVGRSTLVVYSDFQKNMLDLSGVAPDTSLLVVAVPLRASSQANLSVDTVWLASPVVQTGMTNDLHVVVTNHGDRSMNGLPLNLNMDGRMVATTTVDVEAGGHAEVVMQLMPERTGDIQCTVTLMDYPICFDDTYRFVVGVKPKIKVVELNSQKQPTPVALVFSDDPQYDYVAMSPNGFDLETLSKAQLIVVGGTSALNETARRLMLDHAEGGVSVAFFHDEGDADTNTLRVSDLALRNEFFSDMILDLPQHADLPLVKQHVRLTPAPNTTTLMHLANGDPLLTERKTGEGRVYDFATTLDAQWSNLADNSIFVPLMLKMALLGGGVGKMAYTLGVDPSPDEVTEAGFYELMQADTVQQVTAWNDSRLESDLRVVDDATLASLFKEAGMTMTSSVEARKSTLWRWWVLLALMAVLGEVAVLRFWK